MFLHVIVFCFIISWQKQVVCQIKMLEVYIFNRNEEGNILSKKIWQYSGTTHDELIAEEKIN